MDARGRQDDAEVPLFNELRDEATASSALRKLWDADLPRHRIVTALLTGGTASAAAEFELIAASRASLPQLSACAVAATSFALKQQGAPPCATRLLLACARSAARRRRPRAAARIAAVAERLLRDGPSANAVFALADAGFVRLAASAAVRAAESDVIDEPPALLHATLLLLPRVDCLKLRAHVADAARATAIAAVGDAMIRACLLAFRAAASEDSTVVDALVSAYERALQAASPTPPPPPRPAPLTPLDVACVFVLLACVETSSEKRRILELLRGLFTAPSATFASIPCAASSSSSAAPPLDAASRVLRAALEIPGVEEWGALIADICDSLLRAPDAHARSVAASLAAHLFIHHERARSRLLGYTLDAVSDPAAASDGTDTAYAGILTRLAKSPNTAILFRGHTSILTEWLPLLTTIDFESAAALSSALAAIAAALPVLADKLIIHVRKLLSETSTVARLLAVSILVSVAEAPATAPALFEEVSGLIRDALRCERDLRIPTLARIVSTIRRASNFTRAVRWAPINRVVMEFIDTDTSFLSLSSCFMPCCDTLPARKDVPLLLSYANILRTNQPAARRFTEGMNSYLIDGRRALVEACNPPISMNDAMQSRWVATRTAMLIALCQAMICPDSKAGGSSSASTSASSRDDDSSVIRVAVVYALAFLARDAVPRALRVQPCHDRSCSAARSAICVTAREKCANETLSSSKTFAELERAGAIEGECSLDAESCAALLAIAPSVNDIAGKFVGSVLRAEVFVRLTQVLRSAALDVESSYAARQKAVQTFCDTNPVEEDQLLAKKSSEEQSTSVRKSRRKSTRVNTGQSEHRATKKRRRCVLKPESKDVYMPLVPARNRSVVSPDVETEDGTSQVSADSTVRAEIQEVMSEIRYTPARQAILDALGKDEVSEESRLALRSASIGLLLHTNSNDFRPSEWSFLVGSSGVIAQAPECVRELVSLFECDFRRAMTPSLAFDYITLFEWFLEKNADVGQHLAGAASRILSEYRITQIRIVRGLFALLLDALADDVVLPVVQQVFAWLGEEQGVLDPQFRGRGSYDANFDLDIVEEAAKLDGVSTADLDEKYYPRVSNDDSTPTEEGDTLSCRGRSLSVNQQSCLPDGTPIRKLGLNDSDESSLVCVYAALDRLKTAVPTAEELRELNEFAVNRLGTAVSALGALLATQRGNTVKWSRPTIRRVADATARVLGAADTALDAARREMRNDASTVRSTAFSHVLAVCAQAIRNVLVTPAGRAVVDEGKAKRAAAKLQLHVPAALADLASTARDAPGVKDIEAAYRELAGIKEVEQVKAPTRMKAAKLRSRNKVVDAWLQEEDGDDNFADLEDFVCGMDEELV